MRKVPRHLFVPNDVRKYSYEDRPLPIGYGQTISQPYIVALMTELIKLNKNSKVLEIGTGSGYQAAVLAQITDKVYTVVIYDELSKRAQKIFNVLGYNINTKIGEVQASPTEYTLLARLKDLCAALYAVFVGSSGNPATAKVKIHDGTNTAGVDNEGRLQVDARIGGAGTGSNVA